MSKHTPAPWRDLGAGGIYHRDSNGDETLVAHVPVRSGKHRCAPFTPSEYIAPGPRETCANIALIEAAPELLEACEAMLDTWGSCDEDAIIAARDQARAAIAKATGEASE